uniref:Uncharacterized protein n=1 Tax=Globisporangium ultimum (strain ATCC 200006 / CBS 805.95 / DAOM BR144) TaxID=431595 RepID=K3WY25_GLOUD
MMRQPVFTEWARINEFIPKYNNVNACAAGDTVCTEEKARRRTNFLKLEAAHFFASPLDGTVVPWQGSLLGQYSEVDTLDEIETEFSSLKIINNTETREYVSDTYGLQTLDKRGGVFFHAIENIVHMCWMYDFMPAGSTDLCLWKPLYDNYLAPVLNGPSFFTK